MSVLKLSSIKITLVVRWSLCGWSNFDNVSQHPKTSSPQIFAKFSHILSIFLQNVRCTYLNLYFHYDPAGWSSQCFNLGHWSVETPPFFLHYSYLSIFRGQLNTINLIRRLNRWHSLSELRESGGVDLNQSFCNHNYQIALTWPSGE